MNRRIDHCCCVVANAWFAAGRQAWKRPNAGVHAWVVLLWLAYGWLAATVHAAPPLNFAVEDVVTGLEQPMAIRFLPDGRLLLALKKGEIRIVTPQTVPVQSQVYLNLATAPAGLDSDQERGVLDLAVDPSFPTAPYIYVFYTPASGPSGARARVARFTHVANSGGVTSRGNTSSETILWQDTQGYDSCCHFGGGLDFGPDGNLWVTPGDHFQGSYANDLAKSGGKVHRITKTGAIPAGNPYNDGAGPNVDSIFAYGLRNPFRARWDLPGGRFFIGEVGGNTQSTAWEDLHVLRYDYATARFVDSDFGTGSDNGVYNGINFGWPTVEGALPHTDFPGFVISANVGEPLFAYKHSGQFAAINGGVVYRGTKFPAAYSNAYFYADSTRDFIRYLKFNTNGAIQPNPSPAPIDYKNPDAISRPFDLSPTGRIVSLEVGPDGALYYVSFTDSGGAYGEPNPLVLGAVRRYVYDGGNARPVINNFSVTPSSGTPPLAVNLALRATDPEAGAMTYFLNFGNGTPSTSPKPLPGGTTTNISYTYTNAGSYSATAHVSDGTNTTSQVVGVLVGTPPVVTSLTVTNSRPGSTNNYFRYGDALTFKASATDVQDGPLTGASFSWSISFIRPGNTHPAFGPVTGTNAINFPIPNQGQGFSGPVYYRCFLTVTDASGLSTPATIDIFPEKSNIAFDTVPSGLTVQVDGNTAKPTPFVLDSLINVTHVITVPASNCVAGSQYVFQQWSNGSNNNQILYVVPVTNSALTASFVTNGPCAPTPTALITGGLVVQLESDLNVALQTTNIVAGWLDQSGLGNDMVASGTPRLGTVLTPSGKPALSLNGTTDKIERAAALGGVPGGNADRTLFVLAKYNSSSAWAGIAYGTGTANQAFGIIISHPTGQLALQGWGGGNDLVSTNLMFGAGWSVQAGMVTGGNGTLFKDGAQIAQFAHAYNTALARLVIGQEIANLGYVGMDVAAVLLYNRALSGAERTQVGAYLRDKYFNRPPAVTITSPTNNSVQPFGSPITFTASVTDDFDGGALAAGLQWSSSINGPLGTGASFSSTALSLGTHVVTASVFDSGGLTGSTNITVTVGVGNNPPVITSLTSTNSRPGAAPNVFRYGDTLTLAATATDPQDGLLRGANFSWSIFFVRSGTNYPALGPVTGTNRIQFPIPNQAQGFSGPVFYRCFLTVTDSNAASASASIDLFPEKASITVDTLPGGLAVQVDGAAARSTPFLLDALVNYNHVLAAVASNCLADTRYVFDRWSTGSVSNQILYNVPATNATVRASYVTNGSCPPPWGDLLVSGLVVRLESDTGVTLQSSNIIATWLDQSGLGNHLTASGSARLGTVLTPAGRPAISLNGTTGKLERTATLNGLPGGNSDRTMFIAARYNSTTARAGVSYGVATNNRAFGLVARNSSGRLTLQGYGNANDLVSSVAGVGGGWLVQGGTVSGGKGTLYKNATQISQFTHTYDTALSKFVIGQEIGGSGYAGLDLAAVLLYNRALSATERTQVTTYLHGKYVNTAPVVAIVSPTNGSLRSFGEPTTVTASVADDFDGVELNDGLEWRSGLQGHLGRGAVFFTSALVPGTHVLTASVTDGGGLTGFTNVTVTVADTGPPVLTLLGVLSAEATGPGGAVVPFSVWAHDLVNGPVPAVAVPAPGSLLPLGVTLVNVSAVDLSGNVTNASFALAVQDTTPPVLTLLGPDPLALAYGDPLVDPGATAMDLVDGDVSASVAAAGGVATNTPGAYLRTYTASDQSGNTNQLQRVVTVEIVAPPLQVELLPNPTRDVRVRFPSRGGLEYQLWTTTNLAVWNLLETLPGNDSMLVRTNTGGAVVPGRYYRLNIRKPGP